MFKLEDFELPAYHYGIMTYYEDQFGEIHKLKNPYITFMEPRWMDEERTRRTLPYLTDLIIDESMPNSEKIRVTASPLYSHRHFGRISWIQTLGRFQHQPAYDNLREVWLHDSDSELRKYALRALGSLSDKRTLTDVKKRVLSVTDSFDDWKNYLSVIKEFKNDDEALDIIEFMKECVLDMNSGILIEDLNLMEKDAFYGGPMEQFLGDLMLSYSSFLSNPRTIHCARDLAKKADCLTVGRRYGTILDAMEDREKNRKITNLVVPEKNEIWNMFGGNPKEIPF